MSGLVLRPVESADQPFLFQLFCANRPELAGLPEPLLQMQFRAQMLSYGAQYAELKDQVLILDGRPVGRLLTADLPEVLRLVDIALLPEVQGRGIGMQLLQDLQQRAASAGKGVGLAVVATNPAQRLYERLGFVVIKQEGPRLQMIWTPGGATCSNP